MAKRDSRFAITEKVDIEEKYVLYVEDLHVSFKGNSLKVGIINKIKFKKKILRKNKRIFSKKEIANIKKEIYDLKIKLKDVEYKSILNDLKQQYKNASSKQERKDINNQILETKELMVKYAKGKKHVLRGATVGLRQGETLAIVGANGAGKTVLLETILGFNIPDKYEKMVLNLGHKRYSDNLKEVGIQYQQAKMPTNYKVREAINNQMSLHGKRINKNEVQNMINEFGILEFIDSTVEALSGGQKQRLNLLLAVMHQPKIMILDEFITGLDVNSVRKIISYVNELKVKNNASMIIISHQPEEIEALSDRIVIMKDGKITEQTNVANVLKEYGTMATFVEEVI